MLGTLRKFLAPPVFEDEGVNFNARNLNVILLSAFLGIVITVLRYIALGKFWQGNAGFVFLVTGAIIAGTYILFQQRYVLAGSVIAIVILTLMPFALILMSGNGVHDTAIMILPVVVVITSMLLPWQGLVGYVLLVALAFGVLVRMEVNQNLITPFSSLTTNSDFTDALTILIVAGLMSGLLVGSLRRNLRQLGDALKERGISEERYRLISNLSSDYVFSSTVHKDGTITHDWQSGAFESMSGYTPEEFLAHGGWRSTLHPNDLTIDDQMLNNMFSNQKVVDELRVLTKSGDIRWVRVYAQPVWNENENRLVGIYGAVQDVTEEKFAEEKLRQHAEQLASLNEVGRSISSVRDLDSVLKATLEQMKKILPLDVFYVGLYHPVTNTVSFPIMYDSEEFWQEPETSIDSQTSWVAQVRSSHQPFLIKRTAEELTLLTPDNPVGVVEKISASIMMAPMEIDNRFIGVVSIHSYILNAYSQDDLMLLNNTANQIAIAVENARLFSEVQQELAERKRAEETLRQRESLLEAITFSAEQFLKTPNWREKMNIVLGRLGKEFNASHAYVFEKHVSISGVLLNSLRHEWVAPGQKSDMDNPAYQNAPVHEREHSHYYKILDSGKPFVGSTSFLFESESERAWMNSTGIKALLEMRIVVDGKQWGTIGFDDMVNEREWNLMEVDVIKIAANVLAAAIEREQADNTFRQSEERHRIDLEGQVVERTSQLILANQSLQTEKMRIEQVVDEVATLRRLSDFLQSSMTVDEASGIVASHMNSLFTNTSGGLYLINDGFIDLALMSSWGEFKTETVIQPNDCWGMRRGRSFVRHTSDASPACAHFGGEIPDESLCLPLMGQNEIIGMLCLQIAKSENTYFTQDAQNLAVASADSIALALANLRLRERLHDQSIRDALTGLFNRRFMEETLAREVHRASRSRDLLCVVMFEIDDFKVYNNTFGHEAGNYVLKKVADTMRANLRRSDFPCRYGGDEFTLILPETSLEDGGHRAEELRKAVEALALSFNNQALGQVTVRMGVAAYPKHGETGEAVLKVADDASYRARAIGKNCVVVAE